MCQKSKCSVNFITLFLTAGGQQQKPLVLSSKFEGQGMRRLRSIQKLMWQWRFIFFFSCPCPLSSLWQESKVKNMDVGGRASERCQQTKQIQAAAFYVWLKRVLAKPVCPWPGAVHSKLDMPATTFLIPIVAPDFWEFLKPLGLWKREQQPWTFVCFSWGTSAGMGGRKKPGSIQFLLFCPPLVPTRENT